MDSAFSSSGHILDYVVIHFSNLIWIWFPTSRSSSRADPDTPILHVFPEPVVLFSDNSQVRSVRYEKPCVLVVQTGISLITSDGEASVSDLLAIHCLVFVSELELKSLD